MTTPLALSAYDVSEETLPLDRELYLSLAPAVLSLSAHETSLQPRDYERLARQLAAQARVLAENLRRLCIQLPEDSMTRDLSEILLGETERRLSAPPRATMARVQNLARLVRALYERLDCLHRTAGLRGAVFSS
ncbi:restriction endonuclease [Streptomyces sp. NPDC050703]|uniref:restriction endonuclease n=1 Tax=Streptomyces sp. NPDC050703 TaxID=3157218 RepID=UPI003437F063